MLFVHLAIAVALVYVMIYMVTDSAQKFFYDQTVPGLWWRALVCAVPLGGLMILFPFRFDDAFVSGLHWIILQAAAWSLLLKFACQFHTGHAVVVGTTSFLLFAWIVTMALDSLFRAGALAG